MRDCAHVRGLFGAYWDDETTQAEREWLEAHLVSCAGCRDEYESVARSLEWVGSLPRHEASPHLLERTLARAPDRMLAPRPRWVPATAAAALLVVAVSVAAQWLGLFPVAQIARGPRPAGVREPELVGLVAAQVPATSRPGGASSAAEAPSADLFSDNTLAGVPDSLFDHSEDVEFILDPVTVNRGRAAVSRSPATVQGQQAVITF